MIRIKRRPVGVIFICAVVVAVIIVVGLHYLRRPTITGYVDTNLWVYECSRPIKAKQGITPTLPGLGDNGGNYLKGLVPADMVEAKKYCQATGIE